MKKFITFIIACCMFGLTSLFAQNIQEVSLNANTNGDTIEATVISSRDDADLARNLSESKLYRSDLRKSVQPDNQETIFTLDLRSLLP